METFKAYFRKELKESRAYLAGIILMLPATFSVLGIINNRKPASDRSDLFFLYALFALVMATSVFGLDRFGGEFRRGGFHFLNRLPAGMIPMFLAKIASFLLLTVVTWTSCVLMGLAIHTHYVWLVVEPHRIHVTLSRYYDNNWHFLCSIVAEWPRHLSCFLSSCFVLIAFSCWARKLGLGLLFWIIYAVFMFKFYEFLSEIARQDLISQGMTLPNYAFFLVYPIMTFILAFAAFTLHGSGFCNLRSGKSLSIQAERS